MIHKAHLFRLLIVFGFFLSLTSCLKDKATEPFGFTFKCEDTVSYSTEIAPLIINLSCNFGGCHNAGTSAGGYAFTDHAAVSTNSDIIFKAITHQSDAVSMPLGGEILADSLLEKFYCWMEQGELDN
jgi:hypothetical protein